MAKILAIMASAEINWNTDTILDKVFEKLPKNSYEKVILKEIEIEYYSYEYKIPKLEEKEFIELSEKIKKADILVIATPTYMFWVPAKLKTLIERIWYISLDYKNKDNFWNPIWKLKSKTFFIVTWWLPNFLKNIIFFLYPNFWLRIAFKFYWAKNIWWIYIGWLSYTNHIKNLKNKERLEKVSEKVANKLKKYI